MIDALRTTDRFGLRLHEALSFRSLGIAQLRAQLRRQEQKVFSQNGEDGLLEYIFSQIGMTDRQFVEIGCENGVECNTAHLSLVRGWSGLLLDANETYIAQGLTYYRQQLGPAADRVKLRAVWVTRENVNDIVAEYTQGEIDLLSIDVDGIDYYLWQALTVISPRVVVIEYNGSLDPSWPAVVRYDPAFERFAYHPSGYYHGASLAALAKLAAARGYTLVGCDSQGVNAFFVKQNIAPKKITPLIPTQAYYPCLYRLAHETLAAQYFLTRTMDFIEV